MVINPDKTKIILVGNSKFPNWYDAGQVGDSKSIPNVDQNIEKLKETFFDDNFFGIPDDGRHLIAIKDETSQQILLKVKHETQSERSQFERLIFYYAGHGIPGEDKKLFLASNETNRSDYEITSVDSTRLFSYLNRFGASELIIILDCCYAAQSQNNLGDQDSLIEKCLPEEKSAQEIQENGTYYLFASGKDNVAKFNPQEPKTPTYFTKALLNSMTEGTEPGIAFIEIGKLFQSLQSQILRLKNETKTDIPNPRPILVGDANGFLFCKNIKFENEEDKDWAEIKKDIDWDKIKSFSQKYPETRFRLEIELCKTRIFEGKMALKEMKDSKNNIRLADDIMKAYSDIPSITKVASDWKDSLMERAEATEKRRRPDKTASSNKSKAADSDSRQEVKAPAVNWGESYLSSSANMPRDSRQS